jgi:hypothetical protein
MRSISALCAKPGDLLALFANETRSPSASREARAATPHPHMTRDEKIRIVQGLPDLTDLERRALLVLVLESTDTGIAIFRPFYFYSMIGGDCTQREGYLVLRHLREDGFIKIVKPKRGGRPEKRRAFRIVLPGQDAPTAQKVN